MAGAFSKHRFQIYNQNQHPYKHNLSEFAYSSAGLPGVTNVEEAMDWLIATIYPLTQSAVALKTDLPTDTVITFSVAGRVQGAPAAFSVGDLIYLTTTGTLPPSYAPNVTYKILDKDGTGLVLGQQDGTAIAFVAGGSGVHTLHSIDNAFRVVFDDGDGKAAAYRWETREGDLTPSWYKVYDMDWSQDSILSQFQNITQDLYAYKMGKDDLDVNGTPIAGVEGGQHIYGGATAGRNLTLHANAGDAPGVHSGAIRADDPVHPTTDNLFDIGTALLRFKSAYLAVSAQIGTMAVASGSITDSTGTISFDNENLVTTGDISGAIITGSTSLKTGTMTITGGSIVDTSGTISFDNENLVTTGNATAARYNLTNGGFIREIVANDLQISASSGFVDFNNNTLRNLLAVITSSLTATTATLGDLSISAKTISSTGRVIVAPNAADKFFQVLGGVLASENSTFSANLSVGVDLNVLGAASIIGNAAVGGTFAVTGVTTLGASFLNGDISTAGTFLNFLKYIVAPRLDAATVNATDTNSTTFKGTNLTDPTNVSVLISDVVKFPYTATTQDFVPHWDTATTRYIAKAITYPAHSGLVGLGADDHSQYALLAGRTGGQTIAGAAAAAAGDLRLIGQAGAAGANKIIVDDKIVPGANANFTSSWQGYDLGSTTENLRHVYSKGEHFGLRFENVATLPAANVANIGRIVFNTADGKSYVDIGGTWKALGTGTGGGSINLITDGNADDASASIFVPYADTGIYPVDGVGGSPSVTTSVTSTSPLSGTKSYLLTKPAAGVQGQGWAVTVPIDLAYRGKSLKISFDYLLDSGAFNPGSSIGNGDIIWTCYDITNSKLVEPSNIKMFASSTTVADKFEATVQFDVNCTSFRLIGHIGSVNAGLTVLKLDNVTVSPQNYAYTNLPLQNILLFQSAGTSTATAATDTLVNLANIASGTGTYSLTGNGVVVQSSGRYKIRLKIEIGANAESITLKLDVNGAKTSGRSHFVDLNASGSTSLFEDTFYRDLVAGDLIKFFVLNPNTRSYNAAEMELTQLSSAAMVRVSDGFDGRVVTAKATRSTAFSLPNNTNTKVVFDVVAHDDVGGFASGTYTVKTAGKYRFSGHLNLVGSAATFELAVYLYVNGSPVEAVSNGKNGTASQPHGITYDFQRNLSISDTVEIWGFQNSGGALNLRANDTVFGLTSMSVEKIAGPQAIADSESIHANYETAAGQSIASTTETIIDFGAKVYDTHGLVTTGAGVWKFTANMSGRYRISALANIGNSVAWAVNTGARMSVFKNGSLYRRLQVLQAQAANTFVMDSLGGSTVVDLIAGDYIQIAVWQNQGTSLALSAVSQANYVTIERVK